MPGVFVAVLTTAGRAGGVEMKAVSEDYRLRKLLLQETLEVERACCLPGFGGSLFCRSVWVRSILSCLSQLLCRQARSAVFQLFHAPNNPSPIYSIPSREHVDSHELKHGLSESICGDPKSWCWS